MKKVLMLALFTMVILGCVFSATFEMYQAVDDFGDPVGEKIIKSKVLNGTYKTSSVQDGKISYTISITEYGDIQIRIVEAGNTGNLVGAKYTSDTFSVTIRPDSGSDVYATASIKQGDDKKYNILQFSGASALAAFTDHKSVRIVIKNDRATYSLGTVDTSEVEGLYYNKALNDQINRLLASKNYEEVIRLIKAEGDTRSATHYGFSGKLKQAEKAIYLDEAQDLYNKGRYEEARARLSEMEKEASGTYKKYEKEISLLLDSCRKATAIVMVGDRGPARGWIFYDKGYYSDGWRYLEAAPADLSGIYVWGPDGKLGTATDIGTGKSNTDKIPAERDGKKTAAQACREYSVNGYDDWFLPSRDELNQMYLNLNKKGIGGFSSYYLSSSESYYDDRMYNQNFLYGIQDGFYGGRNSDGYGVRPVRAF